ncbi:TIGR00282 family metallophosphoesterase [Thermoproteota archaeon]
MNTVNILCLGDIVGRPGRDAISEYLATIKQKHAIDLTIANAENAAGGFGLNYKIYNELLDAGCDILTSGNHIYDKKEIIYDFDKLDQLIRPLNFPKGNPGYGYKIVPVKNIKVAVINLIGRVFVGHYDCPFQAIDTILPSILEQTPIVIIDMHAETTSEKEAMGWYLDGKVSLVFGTHTHVMTADLSILTNGTGYITDLGMAGALDSVLGMDRNAIIKRFLTQMPERFEPPKKPGQKIINAIISRINTQTGKIESLEDVSYISPPQGKCRVMRGTSLLTKPNVKIQ